MSQELIVTLEAKEGKNPGEAIASYGKQIVFLPHGVAAGQNVRVKLVEIGKNDSRGRAMYRGVPAGLEYSESWKDNGDGTASRVTIATDWLGKTSEVGVVETRPLKKRELHPSTQSSFKVIWGNDLASSVVEDSPIRLYTLEEEKVGCGQLVWQRYGERKEPQQPINCSIKGIETSSSCDWYQNRLQAVYHTQSEIGLAVEFYLPGTDGSSTRIHRLSTPWIKMPQWWQAEQEARYPLCACCRQRFDAQNSDGYAKCEECRKEEVCVRCCQKKSTVKNLGGRLVCNDCQPYEEQEQLIAKSLSAADKERIAAEAKKLLVGQVFSQQEGEVILKATLNHITADSRKENLIQKIVGKNFYYFCEDGIYGSKFSPAALQILKFFPFAAGNPLVEMVVWLTSPDFFLRTQVNGESGVSLPQITADQLKQLKVAEFLRGSEADRIAVLEGYRNLVVKLGKESDEAKAVAEILENEKQDYAAALAKIREADEQLTASNRGEIIVNFSGHFRHMGADNQCDVWVIASDGQEAQPDISYRKRYTEEGDKCWKIVGKNDLALRWSRWQEGGEYHESWEVVKLPLEGMTTEQRDGARRVEPHERFSGPGSGFDLSRVGTNKCSVSRELGYDHFWVQSYGAEPVPCDENREPLNPEALLAKQLQEAKQNFESNLAYAKEQVANGSWIRLKFRKGKRPHTGNVQWEAGNKYCKYVLDRFTVYEPDEGEAYYCSFGKVLVETSTTRIQLVRLERPFPEDAPAPQAESVNQSGSPKLAPEMIAALKAKWSN